MFTLIKKLIHEGTNINVAGILIILAIGAGIGVAFTVGKWEWGLIILLGAGFIGMVIAWAKDKKVGK